MHSPVICSILNIDADLKLQALVGGDELINENLFNHFNHISHWFFPQEIPDRVSFLFFNLLEQKTIVY